MDRIAGAPPLADYSVGQRVMTKEGFAGVVTEVLEGPADLTTYIVALDNAMGGGEYAEGEIWPESGRSAAQAVVEHTAVDDYPELGTVLTDRLPPQITTYAGRYDDSHEGPPHLYEDDDDYDDDLNYPIYYHPPVTEEEPWVTEQKRQTQELHDAAQRIALTLPLDPNDDPEGGARSPREEEGYADGLRDGKAGVTRNFRGNLDPEWRAGYDAGWSFGVQTVRAPAVNEVEMEKQLEDEQIVSADPVLGARQDETQFLTTEAGLWDVIKGNTDAYKGYLTYDWCRYRRDAHCYYSKNLNVEASEQMGYAVWVPEDRGSCWRGKWTLQQACPMGQPGPNVEGGFTNATVPFEEGGQRGGAPTDVYRQSGLVTGSLDPVLAFHLISAWRDVQAKAKRIRSGGGVRVVASHNGVVVGHIRGDTNVYETELVAMPGRQSVASWHCGCKWSAYSWGRSGPWKKYEGRMCSHALALSYEIQSRGMFGQDLTLDQHQPSWMDTSIPIRTPNSYDRDKGRYSSVTAEKTWTCPRCGDPNPEWTMECGSCGTCSYCGEVLPTGATPQETYALRQPHRQEHMDEEVETHYLHRGAYAAQKMRPVYEQEQGDKPIVTFVAALLSEGVRYADIKVFAEKAGVENVPALVKEARKVAPFLARVWERVVSLFIEDGKVMEVGTRKVVAPKDVLFPGYDPKKGLAFDPRIASQHTAKEWRPSIAPADYMGDPKDLSEANDKLMRYAKAVEDTLTPMLKGLAARNGGLMEGLNNRFKTKKSLMRKTTEEQAGRRPGITALSMSDSLRYTMLFVPEKYTEGVKHVLDSLAAAGYGERTKNYWGRGDAYNGINVAMTSPQGFPWELQFHTAESINAKLNGVHQIYDVWRESKDPWERLELGGKMQKMFDKVPQPPNVMSISTTKWQPKGLFAWGSLDGSGYRYLLLDSGQILRIALDHSSTDLWDGLGWVHSGEHGRYDFLGETTGEDITEGEAEELIVRSTGFSPDPSYEHDTFTFVRADLHDEPEPALPTTDGADEDENLGFGPVARMPTPREMADAEIRRIVHSSDHHIATEQADLGLSEVGPQTGADDEVQVGLEVAASAGEADRAQEIVARFDQWNQIVAEGGVPDFPHPFEHLGGGQPGTADSEIMAAAQAFAEKTALRTYTADERKQFIEEGSDSEETASNFDRMDISGTHYEALEAAQAKAASHDVDDMWMLDGDPNG